MYIQDRHQEQQHADENKDDKDTKNNESNGLGKKYSQTRSIKC